MIAESRYPSSLVDFFSLVDRAGGSASRFIGAGSCDFVGLFGPGERFRTVDLVLGKFLACRSRKLRHYWLFLHASRTTRRNVPDLPHHFPAPPLSRQKGLNSAPDPAADSPELDAFQRL